MKTLHGGNHTNREAKVKRNFKAYRFLLLFFPRIRPHFPSREAFSPILAQFPAETPRIITKSPTFAVGQQRPNMSNH